MARDFARWFYKSKAWRQCRDAYYISQHGLCERCRKPGLIVHHKTWLTPFNINDPNITLGWDNLQLLCIECHNKAHGGEVTADGVMFDENGDVVSDRDNRSNDELGYEANVTNERER